MKLQSVLSLMHRGNQLLYFIESIHTNYNIHCCKVLSYNLDAVFLKMSSAPTRLGSMCLAHNFHVHYTQSSNLLPWWSPVPRELSLIWHQTNAWEWFSILLSEKKVSVIPSTALAFVTLASSFHRTSLCYWLWSSWTLLHAGHTHSAMDISGLQHDSSECFLLFSVEEGKGFVPCQFSMCGLHSHFVCAFATTGMWKKSMVIAECVWKFPFQIEVNCISQLGNEISLKLWSTVICERFSVEIFFDTSMYKN